MAQTRAEMCIEDCGTYLYIILPPYESVAAMQDHIENIYDAVEKYGNRKILVDATATEKQIPIFELYDLCIYLVAKFKDTRPKIAVIAHPSAVYPDRFGENVVRNRGLDLIRFIDSIDEAITWLGIKRAH